MPEVVSDAGPFLASQLTLFKSAVNSAKAAYNSALSASMDTYKANLGAISGRVTAYITAHPLNAYVDNESFRKASSQYESDLRSIITNYINRANYGSSTRVGNAEMDFNDVLNDANTAFYDKLNSVSITDTDWTAKSDANTALMNTFTTEVIDSITAAGTKYQNDMLDFSNESKVGLFAVVTNFLTERPLVRVMDFRYPVEVVLSVRASEATPEIPATDTTSWQPARPAVVATSVPNPVEIDLKNVGKKTWTGWIGVIVTDQYYKKVEYLAPAGANVVIAPGASATVKRDIVLPKVMTWTYATGAHAGVSQELNLGDTLTYKIVINTII
jgi:hypothetical protein